MFPLKWSERKTGRTREAQVNYMWEEYEVTYSQALDEADENPKNRAEMEQEISQVRGEIRQLGNVNVNAIEEYKELLERHTFMQTQHDDLIKAEETLLGIIEELDTGMRRQFEEKFAQIRREFDKAFKELFGGGKGTLELDEEEDILEAGIRIISRRRAKNYKKYDAAFWRRKSADSHCTAFCYSESKTFPVLSVG